MKHEEFMHVSTNEYIWTQPTNQYGGLAIEAESFFEHTLL